MDSAMKLGKIDDIVFDLYGPHHYVVVDTGGWLSATNSSCPRKRFYLGGP
jgi:hypothetical protein